MRFISIFLLLVGPASFLAWAHSSGTPHTDGLVAAWAFSEGSGAMTQDSSGHGHSGALVGGPLWGPGRFGNAVVLDGLDDHVSVPHTDELNVVTPFTVSVFVRNWSTSHSWGRILNKKRASVEERIPTRALDLEAQRWTLIDPVAVPGGSAAMFSPGKILKSGSPSRPNFTPDQPSLTSTYLLDMEQPTPAWRQVGPMGQPRTYHTLTVLPDGTVLVTGGVQSTNAASAPSLGAEIWDPQSETWSLLASGSRTRSYHSTALLLPDARILVAGSGGCCGAPNQFNAEIFTPPYLLRGPRPTIGAAPSTIGYGSSFAIGTQDGATIASVALMRTGAVTHTFDQSQRYVPLSFFQASGGLTVAAPADGNLAPPGYYLLFLVNGAGVPSQGAFLRIQ